MTHGTRPSYHTGMNENHTTYGVWMWRVVFAAAAVWTALGAIPSLIDPAGTFQRFYGVAPESAMVVTLFRGAWGQSLLFAAGYLLAAFDPWRHAGVVALGGIGKAVYAYRLITDLLAGGGGPLSIIAVVGDALFVLLFALFLVRTDALSSLFLPSSATSTPHNT